MHLSASLNARGRGSGVLDGTGGVTSFAVVRWDSVLECSLEFWPAFRLQTRVLNSLSAVLSPPGGSLIYG